MEAFEKQAKPLLKTVQDKLAQVSEPGLALGIQKMMQLREEIKKAESVIQLSEKLKQTAMEALEKQGQPLLQTAQDKLAQVSEPNNMLQLSEELQKATAE